MENMRKKSNGNALLPVNNGFENLNTISQITVKLQSDMMEFEAQYRARYVEEEDQLKKRNERDFIMKAEGRNELLKKQFNQIKYSHGFNVDYQNENIENNRSYQKKYRSNLPPEKNQASCSDENNRFDSNIPCQAIQLMKENHSEKTLDEDNKKMENESGKEINERGKGEIEVNGDKLSANVKRNERDENDSSGELIIINEFENTRGIKEIEKGHENLLKDFHSGLGARIRELDLIHSAVLADIPTNLTGPRSGTYGVDSQSSNIASGFDNPESGIQAPNSSVTPPVLETGSGSSQAPIGPRVSFGQIGFERIPRPSSDQRIREYSYLNDRQGVLINPELQGGQGRAFEEYRKRSNNNNNSNSNDNNGYNDDKGNENRYTDNSQFISIFDNNYSNRYYDFKNNKNNLIPTFINNYPTLNDCYDHNNNYDNDNNNNNDNNNGNNNGYNNTNKYGNSDNNFRNNNNLTYENYRNTGNFRNSANQYENNRNKQNQSNYNNGGNGNRKTCVLGTDVHFHPYAQHPYVPSLGPDIMHSNILTVSKGKITPT